MSFYEVCKILINTDTFHKDGAPHLMLTAIDFYTQENPTSVEFDYEAVYQREDKYQDIVGFYHTHPSGMNKMSQIDIDTMTQWVRCLGKSLVCVIETEEQKNAWLFVKEENGKVSYRDALVASANDINYDIWLDAKRDFWSPADFLLEGEYFMMPEEEIEDDEVDDVVDTMLGNMDNISGKLDNLTQGFNNLLSVLQKMIDKAK